MFSQEEYVKFALNRFSDENVNAAAFNLATAQLEIDNPREEKASLATSFGTCVAFADCAGLYR